jgi:hypothetical protein
VIVLQAGADTLRGDLLGDFNLSFLQRAKIFKKVLDSQVPILCLGGGGYTIENVARQWTTESALAAGLNIEDIKEFQIQGQFVKEYSSAKFFYEPAQTTHQRQDLNSSKYLNNLYEKVDTQLRQLSGQDSDSSFMHVQLADEDEEGNCLFSSQANIE